MFRRRLIAVLSAVAILSTVVASIEAAPLRMLRDQGWVVDDRYGKKHANPESAQEILKAVDAGEKLVFWSESEEAYYPIEDQVIAKLWIGKRVEILGNVMPDGTLRVGNYREAKEN